MSKPPKAVREIPAEGAYKAVCVQVIDLGTQPSNNPKWADARRVLIAFELQGKKKKSGEPFVVGTRYNFSSSKKSNLAKDLKLWLQVKDVRSFDVCDCIGKAAELEILHSDDGEYANINSVLPYKGAKLKTTTEPIMLMLDETFDSKVYANLWDSMKETIARSPEYDALADSKPASKKGKK